MFACVWAESAQQTGYRGRMTSTPDPAFPEDAELKKLHALTENDIQAPEEKLLGGLLPHPTPTEAIGSVEWEKPFVAESDRE